MKRARIAVAALLLASVSAQAYPSFIAYGYNSCLSCHFNALGNGPLTPYGRALSATVIAAKPFYARNASDEELGEQSNFLGPIALPRWVSFDANYRGLALASQVQARTRGDWVNMKADGDLVLKPASWIWAAGNFGYHPSPNPASYPRTTFVSREHYLALQPLKSLRVYTGFMDVAYGIRIPDHIAFSRDKTGLDQDSQVHAVTLHYGTESTDAAIQGFMGNLYDLAISNRWVGGAGTWETDVEDRLRMGASAYYGQKASQRRMMGSVHVRAGTGEGSSILSELGMVDHVPLITGDGGSTLATYLLIQTLGRISRGFNFICTGEFYSADTFAPGVRLFRATPALQYIPMQRLELRFDVIFTRKIAGPRVERDGVDLLGQVHLWL